MNANAVKDIHYEQYMCKFVSFFMHRPRIYYITNALKNVQISIKFSGSHYNFFIIDTDILLLQNSFFKSY